VTVISLLTILSLINSVLLVAPRILYAIGRDGLLTRKAAVVSEGGTPRIALLLTSLMVVAVILSGNFEQVVAMYAVLFLVTYVLTFLAVFVLRYREPATPRPFKAIGYPFSTATVLFGSVAFLIAAIVEDLRSGVIAGVFLGACIPVYMWLARGRR
jgi:APA family basic amino acid/polyamine antiporter